MRKSLLKTIVATAVIGVTMILGNAITFAASGDIHSFIPDEDESAPTELGLIATSYSTSAECTGTFIDSIFTVGGNPSNSYSSKKGLNPNKETLVWHKKKDTLSTQSGKFMVLTPTVSGHLKIYAARGDSAAKSDTIKIYEGEALTIDNTAGYYFGTSTQLGSSYSLEGNSATDVKPIEIDVVAEQTYIVYANNNNSMIFGLELTEANVATTTVTTTNSTSKPAVITVVSGDTSTYYAVALMEIPTEAITGNIANVTAKIYQENKNEIAIANAYKSVSISGNAYAGNNLGGNANHYLYAVKIDASSITENDVPAYIQENVKVSATVNSAS